MSRMPRSSSSKSRGRRIAQDTGATLGNGDQDHLPGTPTPHMSERASDDKKHEDLVEKFHVRGQRRMSMQISQAALQNLNPHSRRNSFGSFIGSTGKMLRKSAKSFFSYRQDSSGGPGDSGVDDQNWEVDALKDGSDLRDYDEFYIDPRSPFRKTWDLFIITLVMYSAIAIPYYSAFSTTEAGWQIGIDYTFDLLFVIDIVLNFFTAYYDKFGRLVANRQSIKHNYLRSWFVIDVLASFPFELAALAVGDNLNNNSDIFSLFKFPRLLRLGRILKFIERLGVYANIWRIFRLLGFIILVLHWVTCLWHLTVCSDTDSFDGAIEDLEKLAYCEKGWDSPGENSYLQSSYWAVLLLLGNDVYPFNKETMVLSVIMLLIGSFLYAAVFGIVAALMNALQARDLVFRNKIDSINDIIRYLNMPEELGERVRQYYEYVWIRYRDLDTGLDEFTRALPPSLRDEVLLFMHSELLRKVPLFKSVEPIVVLEVVRHMKTVLALPGDIVIRKGDPASGVYIISRGSCEVLVSEDISVGRDIQKMIDSSGDSDNQGLTNPGRGQGVPKGRRSKGRSTESGDEEEEDDKKKDNIHELLSGSKVSRHARRRLSNSSINFLGGLDVTEAAANFVPQKDFSAAFTNESREAEKAAPVVSASNPVLSSGDHFGERSLITGEPVNASVMAISFCDLHLLHKNDFHEIMGMNPSLKEVLIKHREHVFNPDGSKKDTGMDSRNLIEMKKRMQKVRRKSTTFEERTGIADAPPVQHSIDSTDKEMFLKLFDSIQERLDGINSWMQTEESNRRRSEQDVREQEELVKSLLQN